MEWRRLNSFYDCLMAQGTSKISPMSLTEIFDLITKSYEIPPEIKEMGKQETAGVKVVQFNTYLICVSGIEYVGSCADEEVHTYYYEVTP